IVDAQGSDQQSDQDRFVSVLEKIIDDKLAADCIVGMSASEREAIWAPRHDVDQFHQYRPWFGFDVSMHIRHMESYVAEVQSRLNARWPDNRAFIFGHMGDGNLHLNIHAAKGAEDARHEVEEIVYNGLAERQGSISAEHGIGLEKRDYLKL